MKHKLTEKRRKVAITLLIAATLLSMSVHVVAHGAMDSTPFENQGTRISTVGVRDSAYINGDQDMLNYDGVTITENLPKTTTGSISQSMLTTEPTLQTVPRIYNEYLHEIKPPKLFAEYDKGAHYYAFSVESTNYTEAFSNIKLPTGFNNGNRNGYISLGIWGSHGIDLGLCNEGNGWFPYIYDVNHSFSRYNDYYTAPSSAKNAIITVKPVSTTSVNMYVQFLNSSGTNVGNTFDRTITVSTNNLVYSGGKIKCRFYRFASLVPLDGYTDNRSDGTSMTGGKFTNCQLYNGSNYVSWGINTARMANVWRIYPGKISLSYTTYNDTFSINHS